MNISPQQQSFYNQIQFLSSISTSTPFNTRNLTPHQLYEVCQYIQPFMIAKDKFKLANRISQFKDFESGDTCLHIASKASNTKLVSFLLQNNLVNANTLNKKQETALTSLLANNSQSKSQKIGYILAKHTDLNIKNKDFKKAFEVSQAKMDPMRARLLEHLKNLAKGI